MWKQQSRLTGRLRTSLYQVMLHPVHSHISKSHFTAAGIRLWTSLYASHTIIDRDFGTSWISRFIQLWVLLRPLVPAVQISASIQGKHTVSCWLPEDIPTRSSSTLRFQWSILKSLASYSNSTRCYFLSSPTVNTSISHVCVQYYNEQSVPVNPTVSTQISLSILDEPISHPVCMLAQSVR